VAAIKNITMESKISGNVEEPLLHPKCYHTGYLQLKDPEFYKKCSCSFCCTYFNCKTRRMSGEKRFLCCPRCYTEYCSKECGALDKQNHAKHCKIWKAEGNLITDNCSLCSETVMSDPKEMKEFMLKLYSKM
jgi:hypothetical protein